MVYGIGRFQSKAVKPVVPARVVSYLDAKQKENGRMKLSEYLRLAFYLTVFLRSYRNE